MNCILAWCVGWCDATTAVFQQIWGRYCTHSTSSKECSIMSWSGDRWFPKGPPSSESRAWRKSFMNFWCNLDRCIVSLLGNVVHHPSKIFRPQSPGAWNPGGLGRRCCEHARWPGGQLICIYSCHHCFFFLLSLTCTFTLVLCLYPSLFSIVVRVPLLACCWRKSKVNFAACAFHFLKSFLFLWSTHSLRCWGVGCHGQLENLYVFFCNTCRRTQFSTSSLSPSHLPSFTIIFYLCFKVKLYHPQGLTEHDPFALRSSGPLTSKPTSHNFFHGSALSDQKVPADTSQSKHIISGSITPSLASPAVQDVYYHFHIPTFQVTLTLREKPGNDG